MKGGSYIRKPDGNLERVEFTAEADASEPRPDAPAGAKSAERSGADNSERRRPARVRDKDQKEN